MRQIRSADPWSAFLSPSGRGGGMSPALRAGPSQIPGAAEPAASVHRDHGDAPDAADLPEACRLVLGRLAEGRAPQSLEQLHHATGLGLLEVADAVERLVERGLVGVEREVDELVRLAGPGTEPGR